MTKAGSVAVAFGLAALGCSKSGDSGTATAVDPLADAAADDAATTDACQRRGEDLDHDTTRTSDDGHFSVTLLQTDPALPHVGDNTWTLAVERDGAPDLGAALRVSAWMPDHRHGSLKATLEHELSPGHYQVAPINLQMPGLWQVTIAEDEDAGNVERVVFTFCVAE